MATIKIKNSSTSGNKPDSTQLQVAELAINTADRKLYSKDSGGLVFEIGGSGANVPGGDTPPGSGNSVGDLFFDTDGLQLLYWDGANWVPVAGSEVNSLNDLNDVTITNAATGELLVRSGNQWVNADPGYVTEDEVNNILAGNNPDGTINPNDPGFLKEVNLGYTAGQSSGTVTNTGGTEAVIPVASVGDANANPIEPPLAGLFTGEEKAKLAGIEDGAQVNVPGEVPHGDTASRPGPDDVTPGDLYFDTQLGLLLYWNGTSWEVVGTGAGGGGDSLWAEDVDAGTITPVTNTHSVVVSKSATQEVKLTPEGRVYASENLYVNTDVVADRSGALINGDLHLNTGNYSLWLHPGDDLDGTSGTAINHRGDGHFEIGRTGLGWGDNVLFDADNFNNIHLSNTNPSGQPVVIPGATAKVHAHGGLNTDFGTSVAPLGNVQPKDDWSSIPALT